MKTKTFLGSESDIDAAQFQFERRQMGEEWITTGRHYDYDGGKNTYISVTLTLDRFVEQENEPVYL